MKPRYRRFIDNKVRLFIVCDERMYVCEIRNSDIFKYFLEGIITDGLGYLDTEEARIPHLRATGNGEKREDTHGGGF